MFSRIQLDSPLDCDCAESFSKELENHFENVEIQWRKGLKKVQGRQKANNVKICVNGKALFLQNKKMATLILGNADGKIKEVLGSYKRSGYDIVKPNPTKGYLCAIIYFILIALVFTNRPEFALYYAIATILMIIGLVIYSSTQKEKCRGNFGGSNIASCVFIIPFIMTAPGSVLLIFLIQYFGQTAFYNELQGV